MRSHHVLYDDLSVWEHLEYLGPLHGTIDWQSRSQELLERFELVGRADDLPVTFSRGLRQKTALVLGLVRDHELLAIDEPFVGLDPVGRSALVELLEDHRAAGRSAVVATHDTGLVERADRCVVLSDGRVTHDDPIDPAALHRLIG